MSNMNHPIATSRPRPSRRRLARRGFSLLELMLVLVILGLLSTVAAVALLPQAQAAKVKVTKTSMATIKGQITNYQIQHSRLPETLYDLVPNFLEEGTLKDSWKSEFYYKVTPGAAREYELISFGPDLDPGTDDDINVWTMDFEDEG